MNFETGRPSLFTLKKMKTSLAPAALALILSDDESQVLLVKRYDVPVWVLPGGGIDPGETPEAAVVREVYEETGFTVAILSKSAEYSPVNRLASPTFLFKCRILDGTCRSSSETKEVSFFPLERLPPAFFFLHADWLNENLKNRSIIRRPLSEVSYIGLVRYFLKNPGYVLRFAWTRFIKNRFLSVL